MVRGVVVMGAGRSSRHIIRKPKGELVGRARSQGVSARERKMQVEVASGWAVKELEEWKGAGGSIVSLSVSRVGWQNGPPNRASTKKWAPELQAGESQCCQCIATVVVSTPDPLNLCDTEVCVLFELVDRHLTFILAGITKEHCQLRHKQARAH